MTDFIATFYVDEGDDYPDRVLCQAHVAAKDLKKAWCDAQVLLPRVHDTYGKELDHPVTLDEIEFYVKKHDPLSVLKNAKATTKELLK